MYFRYMAAIFDLPVTPTSEIIYINPSVLLDPENAWVAVGISLLSCAQAELDVYRVYRTPSWIFSTPGPSRLVVQHGHYFHWIVGPQKHRYSRWNFVAILRTSWVRRILSLQAAIFDRPPPVASGSITSSSIGTAVYENGGAAVEILSLSCIAAEILLGSFSPPPPPISNVRL